MKKSKKKAEPKEEQKQKIQLPTEEDEEFEKIPVN